jgi:hypothetical protein
MTHHCIYVCDLHDTQMRIYPDRDGVVPRRLGPEMPHGNTGLGPTSVYLEVAFGLKSVQIDWGAWVASLKPSEIKAFYRKIFDPSKARVDDLFHDKQLEFAAFLDTLEPDKEYGLVAWEQ